jgi:hypothetical protein
LEILNDETLLLPASLAFPQASLTARTVWDRYTEWINKFGKVAATDLFDKKSRRSGNRARE